MAFASFASNLVPGDTNGKPDVFVYNRHTGTTRCLSLGLDGSPGGAVYDRPAIGYDGQEVAFISRGRLVREDLNHSFDAFVAQLSP